MNFEKRNSNKGFQADTAATPSGLTRRSMFAAASVVAVAAMARSKSALADPNSTGGGSQSCQTGTSQAPDCICFRKGTRIETPDGAVAVEALAPGSQVLTASGDVQEVRWVGHMSFTRDASGKWPKSVVPVRIAKDALGAHQPSRDLYVSQAHRLYLEGMLVPAADLINGVTITSYEPDGDTLTYYHIELDHHDVVFADGATCDTLQVTPENVLVFDNHAERTALRGVCTTTMEPYAPIHRFGGGRGKLVSRLRSAVAPLHDIRLPLDVMRDQLEARAMATL